MNNKKAYTKPDVVVYGNVTDLTQGGTSGAFLDAAYDAGTPFDQLTFS